MLIGMLVGTLDRKLNHMLDGTLVDTLIGMLVGTLDRKLNHMLDGTLVGTLVDGKLECAIEHVITWYLPPLASKPQCPMSEL